MDDPKLDDPNRTLPMPKWMTEPMDPLAHAWGEAAPTGDRMEDLVDHDLDWELDHILVLQRAYELIRDKGWIQDGFISEDGYSMDMAVRLAARELTAAGTLQQPGFQPKTALGCLAGEAYLTEADELGDEYLEDLESAIKEQAFAVLTRFNDASGRRKEDILALLCQAISSCWKHHGEVWSMRADRRFHGGD